MSKQVNISIPSSNHEITGVLEKGSEFEGTLSFEGTFRIGGIFRGRIITNDILIIGEGAQVEAEIEAGTLILCGKLIGDVVAVDRAEIHRPAEFHGNIKTPSLMVDDGVVFEGRSQMSNKTLST